MTQLPDYFRPITAEGIDPVKPEGLVGPQIQMKWIPIEKLFVDTRYQRDIAKGLKSNVRQIGRNFRWRRFAPVIVTPIQGTDCFAVIDGQHKTTGALLRGLKIVPCAVVEAATLEEQGDSFKFLNANITRVNVYDIFKSNLASKDKDAQDLDRVVKKAGIRLVPSSTANKHIKPKDCKSYQAVVTALRHFGQEVFIKAGQTLTNNPSSQGVISSALLGALCALFKSNVSWRHNATVDEALNKVNFGVLFNQTHTQFRMENSTHKAVLTRELYAVVTNALKKASTHENPVADPVPLSSLPPASNGPRGE